MRSYFQHRGYEVKLAPHVLAAHGFLAGSAQVRAEDFNGMIRDPAVRMIVTAMGGAGAAHPVPFIDYDIIAQQPKIITALSNPSILLNAITRASGVVTFHGPNGVDFGYGPLTPFSEENFWLMVSTEPEIPYTFPVGGFIRVLRGRGAVEGPLVGGHLRTNQVLIGTPWAPDWHGAVLFIEEIATEPHRIDAILCHLRLAGILGAINALIVGQFVDWEQKDGEQAEALEDMLLRTCADYAFPIITNIPLGHTDDHLTLPIGARVRLDCDAPSLQLLELATC
jgi:muramoyltetrapeptide carboxypeptidase